MTKADGQIIIDTRIDTKGITTGAQDIKAKMNGVLGVVKKVGAAIAAAFAVKQLISFGKECIALGSDLDEVQNVVDVTFGSMSGVIDQFAKDAVESFGLSELSAKQYTSTIGAMLKSMGFTGDAVTEMSIKMAELAGDMASFYNLDTDTAFQKIRSGISGETEPLKQLGINLSEANLEQFRLTQGMDTAYKSMTQQEKALLRYNYLLSVTSDAQGDFSRTSSSWANQLRIAKLRLDSIKADLGKGFINLLTPVLRVINTVIAGIAKMASAFKAFTALITGQKADTSTNTGAALPDYSDAADSAETYADAVDDSTKATKAAQKQNEKYLSGLDQIKRFNDNNADVESSSGGGSTGKTPTSAGSGGTGGIDFGSLAQGETVIDKTAQKMKELYDIILQKAEPAISALKRLWNEGLAKLGEFVWDELRDFWDTFLVPVADWVMGEGLPRFIDAINNGLMKINYDKLKTAFHNLWAALAPFAINVGEGLLWFWENVLVPLRTWSINELLPRFLESLTNILKIFNAVIEALKPLFSWFWNSVLLPIAQWTGGFFTTIWDGINAALGTFAKWCEENPEKIRVAFSVIAIALGLLVSPITTVILLGVALVKNWETIKEKAAELWGNITRTLSLKWEQIKAWASEKFEAARKSIVDAWEAAKTKTTEVWDAVSTKVSTAFQNVKSWAKTKFEAAKTSISEAWDAVRSKTAQIWGNAKSSAFKVIQGAWETLTEDVPKKFQTIKNTIKDTWEAVRKTAVSKWETIKEKITNPVETIKEACEKAGDAIHDAFWNAFDGLASLLKTPINALLRVVNGLIRDMNSLLGGIESAFTFTVYDGAGGMSDFWLKLPRIPEVPYLAKGAVIPPNAPFLATLGDQKHGTNIEAPLETIKQAFQEVNGGGGNIQIDLYLDGKRVYETVVNQAKQRQQMTGLNPFAFE